MVALQCSFVLFICVGGLDQFPVLTSFFFDGKQDRFATWFNACPRTGYETEPVQHCSKQCYNAKKETGRAIMLINPDRLIIKHSNSIKVYVG